MINLTKDTIDDFSDGVKDHARMAVGRIIDSLLYDSVLPSKAYSRVGITKVGNGSIYEITVTVTLAEKTL